MTDLDVLVDRAARGVLLHSEGPALRAAVAKLEQHLADEHQTSALRAGIAGDLRVQLRSAEDELGPLRQRVSALAADVARTETERDGAYRERAQLLAWLSALHPAVLAPAPDVDEDGWQILYLTAGGQQLSWHVHPRDADLLTHVEQVPAEDPRAQWDGHTTAEKYDRIRALPFHALKGATL